MTYRLAVVTRVPPPTETGNLAMPGPLLVDRGPGDLVSLYEAVPRESALGLMLTLRQPVFRVGEVLLLGPDDRDTLGRKPSKWDVDVIEMPVDSTLDGVAATARLATEREVTG